MGGYGMGGGMYGMQGGMGGYPQNGPYKPGVNFAVVHKSL